MSDKCFTNFILLKFFVKFLKEIYFHFILKYYVIKNKSIKHNLYSSHMDGF